MITNRRSLAVSSGKMLPTETCISSSCSLPLVSTHSQVSVLLLIPSASSISIQCSQSRALSHSHFLWLLYYNFLLSGIQIPSPLENIWKSLSPLFKAYWIVYSGLTFSNRHIASLPAQLLDTMTASSGSRGALVSVARDVCAVEVLYLPPCVISFFLKSSLGLGLH